MTWKSADVAVATPTAIDGGDDDPGAGWKSFHALETIQPRPDITDSAAAAQMAMRRRLESPPARFLARGSSSARNEWVAGSTLICALAAP